MHISDDPKDDALDHHISTEERARARERYHRYNHFCLFLFSLSLPILRAFTCARTSSCRTSEGGEKRNCMDNIENFVMQTNAHRMYVRLNKKRARERVWILFFCLLR